MILIRSYTGRVLYPITRRGTHHLNIRVDPRPITTLRCHFRRHVNIHNLHVRFSRLHTRLIYHTRHSLVRRPTTTTNTFHHRPSTGTYTLRLSNFRFSISLRPYRLRHFPSAILYRRMVNIRDGTTRTLHRLRDLIGNIRVFRLSRPMRTANYDYVPPNVSGFYQRIPTSNHAYPVQCLPSNRLVLRLPLLYNRTLLFGTMDFPRPTELFHQTTFRPFPNILRNDSTPTRLAFHLYLPHESIDFRFFCGYNHVLYFGYHVFNDYNQDLYYPLLYYRFPRCLPNLYFHFQRLGAMFFHGNDTIHFVNHVQYG